jgi:hypothetical protein
MIAVGTRVVVRPFRDRPLFLLYGIVRKNRENGQECSSWPYLVETWMGDWSNLGLTDETEITDIEGC